GAAGVEDLTRHLRRRALDEVRSDRRRTRGDVAAVAVEVELDLVADRRLESAHRGVGSRADARAVAAGAEVVAVDRDLRPIGASLAADKHHAAARAWAWQRRRRGRGTRRARIRRARSGTDVHAALGAALCQRTILALRAGVVRDAAADVVAGRRRRGTA